jgi:hypothetical protein
MNTKLSYIRAAPSPVARSVANPCLYNQLAHSLRAVPSAISSVPIPLGLDYKQHPHRAAFWVALVELAVVARGAVLVFRNILGVAELPLFDSPS